MFASLKLKICLLVLLTAIPQALSAYYVFHPCCYNLSLDGWWGSADYMLIWRKERFFHPLVTTNDLGALPILHDPGTRILFGDNTYGGAPKASLQADVGVWVTPCWGAGTGVFVIGQEEISYNIEGDLTGQPILGRPFFNTHAGAEQASLISFPALALDGKIEIDSYNRMWGYDLYVTRRFLASPCFKFDMIAGFYYNGLTDTLNITSHTTVPFGPARMKVNDQFNCANNFYSGLVGVRSEWRSKNWAVALGGQVGLGKMVKKIHIKGHTTTTSGGVLTETEGGLLAQPSNIGEYTFTQFEAIPQGYVNLQLRVWGHLWLKAGYTCIYWPSVLLAGEQVDLRINPNQPPFPPVGKPEPIYHHIDKTFWVQGLTAGFYIFY